MKIISADTSADLKEIHTKIETASGLTLNITVKRTDPGICQIAPNCEDIDEVTDDEYAALDKLSSAFIDILECNEWEES